MAVEASICEFGWKAPDFSLPGVDGRDYGLDGGRGENATVVMFICNHCPYVRAVIERIVRDCRALAEHGVGAIAIMPNDTVTHPTDSFENMEKFARQHEFPFPYVIDETQSVARAYDAICTPDFFGFNKDLALQYRGRLDASRTTLVADARRELYEAMLQIAETGAGPRQQISSMGCSIKWKAA